MRPITAEDLYLVIAEKALHASGEVFAAEIVAGAVDGAARPEAASGTGSRLADTSFMRKRLDELTEGKLGSNALALGKELTASGRGILLGNPHYPWTSTDRFYQVHLTVPGKYDAMGVILGMHRQTDRATLPFEDRTMHTPLGLAIAAQAAFIRETIELVR